MQTLLFLYDTYLIVHIYVYICGIFINSVASKTFFAMHVFQEATARVQIQGFFEVTMRPKTIVVPRCLDLQHAIIWAQTASQAGNTTARIQRQMHTVVHEQM